MRNQDVAELADCTEFRQALHARPPRSVHGTAALSAGLIAAGLCWAAFTEANLVVTTPGVVRPVTSTQAAKARFGGRVIRVYFHEGQTVAEGEILVQLDTEKLDNDIQKREQMLGALEKELAKGTALLASLSRQYEADKATIEAKRAQAEEELKLARNRRELDIRQAKDELLAAERDQATLQRLEMKQAISRSDLDKANILVRDARTRLGRAELPVEAGKVLVVKQELLLATESYQVKRQEAEMRHAAKQGEVQAAQKDLDNLRWEREHACIRSPISGVAVAAEPRVGEIIEAGRVVAELAVQKGFHFEVQVPSADVGSLREGTTARIKLTSFDYERYGTMAGTVCFISPNSKATEQGGVVYTVRIKLEGDEVGRGDFRGQVKLGMAGQAEIVTRRESLLTLLGTKVRQSIRLG